MYVDIVISNVFNLNKHFLFLFFNFRLNLSDGELVAMISMVSDNKILLLGINKIPIYATYIWPLVDNLLRVKGNWVLLIIRKICVNQVFTMSLSLPLKGLGII